MQVIDLIGKVLIIIMAVVGIVVMLVMLVMVAWMLRNMWKE